MKPSHRCKPSPAALRNCHHRRSLTIESLEQRTVLAAGIAVADYQFTNHGINGQDDLFSRDTHADSIASDISSPLTLGSTGNGEPPRGLALGGPFNETTEPTPATNNTDYFTFTITPESGKSLTLSQLVFSARRNDPNSKNSFSIYFDESPDSAGDNFATRLFAGVIENEDRWERNVVDLEGMPEFTNRTEAITFRYYAWGTAGVATQRIDNVRVHAVAEPVNSSKYAYYGEADRLIHPLDAQGNRIPNFSEAGYRNGRAPIPDVLSLVSADRVVTVSPAAGDDMQRIQAAIDQVATFEPGSHGFRGVVQLTAGEFQISDQILILDSGILLTGVGDGADPASNTILRATGTEQRSLIRVGQASGFASGVGGSRSVLDKYVPVGASSFSVNSTDDWQVGDEIIVRRPSTAEWISVLGMDQIPPRSDGGTVNQWEAGKYDHLYERVITRIDGNLVHVNAPIMSGLDQQYGGGVAFKYVFPRIQEVGIENIRGISDFASDTDENHAWTFIELQAVKDSWVSNITGQHFGYATVHATSRALRATIENANSLDPKSQITGGRRYPFNIDGQFILMKDLHSEEGRHDFVNNSRTRNRGPNVFLNGVAVNSHSSTGPHQRFSTGTLYDTITTDNETEARNRGNSGTGHGWAGANMVFWNNVATRYRIENPPTAQNWLIGSVGPIVGTQHPPNSDAHGTPIDFDDANNPTSSLYVAQLLRAESDRDLGHREYVLGDFDLVEYDGEDSDDSVHVDPSWLTAIQSLATGLPIESSDEETDGHIVPLSFQYPMSPREAASSAILTLGLRSTGGDTTDDLLYFDSVNDTRSLASLGLTETLSTSTTTPLTIELLDFDLSRLDDGLLNLAISGNTTLDWAHLEIQVGENVAALSISVDATEISEDGGETTATVTRSSEVFEDLIVNLTSSDTSEATVPASVTIPAGQASATFLVTAIDDTIVDGHQTVQLAAAAERHRDGSVDIAILDDDVPSLSLGVEQFLISENGGQTLATVSRNTNFNMELEVLLSSGDLSEVSLPNSVIIPAGDTSIQFNVTAIDDLILDGTQRVNLSAFADGYATGRTQIDIADDELPELTLDIEQSAISENGGTTNATISRNTDTSTALLITLTSNNEAEVITPDTVTIPTGQQSVMFTISAIDDELVDGTQTVSISASADDHRGASKQLDVTDDDEPEITLAVDRNAISENGETAILTVSRNTSVDSDLEVDLTSGDSSEATLPSTVTIPAGQLSTTVEITGVDDSVVDGDQAVTIAAGAVDHQADELPLLVLDDDSPILSLTVELSSIAENGGVSSATISRNTSTESELSINLQSSDPGEIIVPSSVIIPAGSANATFRLEAVDDEFVDGNQQVTITATSDNFINGEATIEVADDDVPTLTLLVEENSISEKDGSTLATVHRNTPVDIELQVSLISNDTTEATVPDVLVLAVGERTKTFEITGIDDLVVDGQQQVVISASASNHQPASTPLTVRDDDLPTISISFSESSIPEAGGTSQVLVHRNTETTEPLVVSLSLNKSEQLTIPRTITIPAGEDSATFQALAIDDALVDGPQVVALSGVAGGHFAGSDSVQVEDNDSPQLTLTFDTIEISENGGRAVGTIRRNTLPTNELPVELIFDDPQGRFSAPSEVILPENAFAATFQITALDNRNVDGDFALNVEAVAESHSADSSSLSIIDDDFWTWTNANNSFDINDDGIVSPIDVLLVINFLNSDNDRNLPPLSERPPSFYDANADMLASPIDVLLVINEINQPGEGEANGSASFATAFEQLERERKRLLALDEFYRNAF